MMRMRRGPGLIGAAATTAVVAGTAGRVRHRQAQKYAAQDAAAPQPQAAAAPPPAVDDDDPMVQVQKLADLHASGALSDEEFAAAKAKVLGI